MIFTRLLGVVIVCFVLILFTPVHEGAGKDTALGRDLISAKFSVFDLGRRVESLESENILDGFLYLPPPPQARLADYTLLTENGSSHYLIWLSNPPHYSFPNH